MNHRVAILFAGLGLLGVAALAGACSSGSSGGGVSGADASLPETDATVTVESGADAADAGVPDQDVGVDATPIVDAGGPEVKANCSPINSACDIVLQNCNPKNGQPQECVDTGSGTACVPIGTSQHLPRGHACCPNPSKGANPCGAGLQCIGAPDDPCSSDAGLTGRCAPACCDDDVCGKSDPEGFSGRCDLSIVDNANSELFKVCDYNPPCKPFHVEACPSGFTCVVQDKFGTSSCVGIYAVTDAGSTSTGLPEKTPCNSLNACADGLLCVGPPDGGSTCQWACLTPNSNPPFDAGALRDASAGNGGCPSGEACIVSFDPGALPVWLSVCSP
jgi:hypothetical protein